jgi:hypothetical protein
MDVRSGPKCLGSPHDTTLFWRKLCLPDRFIREIRLVAATSQKGKDRSHVHTTSTPNREEAPVPTGVPDALSASMIVRDIARRAYELYDERGRVQGHDVDDWLQAERELQAAASSAVA